MRTRKNDVLEIEKAHYRIISSDIWEKNQNTILKEFDNSRKIIIRKFGKTVIVCPEEHIDNMRYESLVDGLTSDFLESGREQPNMQKRDF